jgi:trk system potassium uptake protein TrkH
MAQLAGSLVQYPARMLFTWYLSAAIVGTGLLMLPASAADPEQPISLLDAAFSATSALCVTGLTVRDTGRDFSFFGQVCFLILIQVGGIGIMTLTTFVITQVSGVSLRLRAVIHETLGTKARQDFRRILAAVLLLAFSAELIGAGLLFVRLGSEYPVGEAMWHSVFHSVSAFCNAGFGVHATSLVRYQSDPWVQGVIGLLIVVGGIGFPVLLDLLNCLRLPRGDRWVALHLHSKLTLTATAIAIVGGGLIVGLLEWRRTLEGLPWVTRLTAPLFHSVSCRTAGFNTLDLAAMTDATLFTSIILMVIGAGSCSTGGGVKISTIGVLIVFAISRFSGKRHTNFYRRTISQSSIDRAAVIVLLYLAVAVGAMTWLLATETNLESGGHNPRTFLAVMFETVSALSTVGLSMGITPELSGAGRCVLIALMFLGRLGPITVFSAIARRQDSDIVEYAHDEPVFG